MSAFDPSLRLRLAMIVWAGAMLLPAIDPARAQAPSAPATQPQAPATQPPAPENPPPPAAQPAPPPAAPPPEAPAGTDAAKKPPGTPAVVIDGSSADTLLGKPVESADGEDMGRIIDVIVDRNGTMRAAIIDFGGFLGVGSRKIAVDWRVLHFAKDSMQRVVAELSRDQLRVAPVYKPGEPVVVVGRADAAPPAPASPPIAPAAAAGPTAGTSTSPPAPTSAAPAAADPVPANPAPATPGSAPPASPTTAPPPPAPPGSPVPNP